MVGKRRILEKIVINEISGVDRPCQEDARVTIMKREESSTMDDMKITELEGAVLDFQAQLAHLNKPLETYSRPNPKSDVTPTANFEQTVVKIRKRDNCTGPQAMAKARRENPEGFEAYQAGDTNADFETLVQAEIAKGSPAAVAAQRVGAPLSGRRSSGDR